MTIFKLPDLGEGLPEAEIHEWYVKVGDIVTQDQAIVSMETAKAVVDVPAPQSGVVLKLYGEPGSIIKTGQPLIEFEQVESSKASSTVVGQLEENKVDVQLSHLTLNDNVSNRPKASTHVKRYAQLMHVNLDEVVGTGEFGTITIEDIEKLVGSKSALSDYEPLKGVRRQMALAMQKSHQQVVPVSIFDDIDISHLKKPFDITVLLIKAVCYAAQKEPALNVWFNGQGIKTFDHVNLGLAIDSSEGLFVPVIEKVDQLSDNEIREKINSLKLAVQERSLPPEAFNSATFTLSNFGKFAGKYASPIIVPPMVAILAVGRLFDNGKLPLSLSFDHRAVTGGEATRFLGAVIDYLKK